jgi:tRNA(Ile)-lysidine synthase
VPLGAPSTPAARASTAAADRFDFEPFDRRLDAGSAAPLAVAYSGGGDSLALLIAAKAWADRVGREVLALHVDHRLRARSRAWAALAERNAAALGAGFRLLSWDDDKPETGLSAAARNARLNLLAGAARDAGARVILLGHTADDVREGEAMRAEGSNLGRLREWSPSPVWPEGRGLFHFRPLLSEARAELRDRLDDCGLDWVEDPANDDPAYARARARRQLVMGVETGPAEPGPAPDITELAGAGRFGPAGDISIGRARLLAAPDAEVRAFVQMALLCAAGTSRPARGPSLDALVARLRTGEAVIAPLSGARAIADRDEVMFVRNAGDATRAGLEPLALEPGRPAVWDGRFELEAPGPDVVVRALAGLTEHLAKRERVALRRLPSPARPALPVVGNPAATMTCPILARGEVRLRSLVGLRFLAAAGAAATESQGDGLAHGA